MTDTMTDPTNPTERRSTYLIVAIVVALAVVIGAIVAVRPSVREVTAGPVDGTVVEIEDGLRYFIWDGAKQRIQQPAALNDEDLDTLGLEIGEPAPPVLTVGEPGTRFVVHPADGPTATLYLEQGGTLHEVPVLEVTAVDLEAMADLGELIIDRVRIP